MDSLGIYDGETHRIVIVEDSEDDERLSRRAVLKSGLPCSIDVIRHGREAIYLLLSPSWPIPRFILLDFHLPGSNGLEIVKEVRQNERMRLVPIVLFSSEIPGEQLQACLLSGANSFVQKATDPNLYTENVMAVTHYWSSLAQSPHRPKRTSHVQSQVSS